MIRENKKIFYPDATAERLRGHRAARLGSYKFGHSKLAVFFARWLDVRFAVWCDLMVDEILRGRVEVHPVAAPLAQDRGGHR